MDVLPRILGSRIRAELFRLLFTRPAKELHVREIERRTGFNDRAIRQELANLTQLGLLAARRDGNRLYYSARRDHPLYGDIRSVTLKTSGLMDVLRDSLCGDEVVSAFVFGSVARGDEAVDSDIDLMVIGNLGMREATRLLRGASEELGREVNPYVLTPGEFAKRVREKEHFLTSVLADRKIMVKGIEDDLAGLGA